MASGQATEQCIATQMSTFAPVHLSDTGNRVVPIFEILPHTERTEHMPDARTQTGDRFIVEMIPVVVGDDKVVDIGHVGRLVDVGALKRFHYERHWRSRIEHRVYKEPNAVNLHVIRRMPKPYEQILIARLRHQVGSEGMQGFIRLQKWRLLVD